MKKMPTLFKRDFSSGSPVLTREVTPGFEWVLCGEGDATIKIDGAACMVMDGHLYKRYDVKFRKKRTVPTGAIPCEDYPDPVTGHWPHWVKVNPTAPEDKWFVEAMRNTSHSTAFFADDNLFANFLAEGTYEAVGKHFNGNPYGLDFDTLVRHGLWTVDVGRTYEEIREFLTFNLVEGLVFWRNGEPCCKIRRTDFGLTWSLR